MRFPHLSTISPNSSVLALHVSQHVLIIIRNNIRSMFCRKFRGVLDLDLVLIPQII